MNMPTSMEELNALTTANVGYEGFGPKTTLVMPCPFCAAPGSLRSRVLHAEEDMGKGGDCQTCGRSWRAEFTRQAGGTAFEIVQTGGDDPPDWFQPKMRRVDRPPDPG